VSSRLPFGDAGPHLEERHRELQARVFEVARAHFEGDEEEDEAAATVGAVRALAREGLLASTVPAPFGALDLRSLVVSREAIAYFSGLADSAFAIQGLGSHPLALGGSEAQKKALLPAVVAGEAVPAFAVTEPEAGSDLGAVQTRATRVGDGWRLDGLKTYISNAGVASFYTVLARSTPDSPKGLSMFLVDGQAPGLSVRPLQPMAPHPLGEVRFEGVPAQLIGAEGRGLALALQTLDTFRPTVGAAACGMARRAMDEAVEHVRHRRQFGQALCEFQAVQMHLADMELDLSGARLLVLHAAFTRDRGAPRITREGALAKLGATEAAQRVIDRALQLHGGAGVMRGAAVERLYREVRALRIYEGATDVQKLVIARQILETRQ
jgi:acyl-CoA dehydrogenase